MKLVDVDPILEKLKEEHGKFANKFNMTSVFMAPNDCGLYGALMQEVGALIDMLEEAPEVDIEERKCSEFCTSCKEYDHKRHSCPRFNRVIKEALEEMENTWAKIGEEEEDGKAD